MPMKLEVFKRLFHPVWDNPADEVEVWFLAPGVGGKWELVPQETTYDVAKKLWTVNMQIMGPTLERNDVPQAVPESSHGQPVEQPAHEHGEAEPHSHDFGGAKHTHEDGVPVADDKSDT